MTRDEAKKLLPIIQAYAEGKVIQLKIGGQWVNGEDATLDFDSPPELYRIKPEPIECWAVITKDAVILQSYRDKPLFRLTFGDPTFSMGVAASALVGYMAPPSELGLEWKPELYGV